jgi:hypothetical protein
MKRIIARIKAAPDYFTLFLVLVIIISSDCYYKLWNDPNQIVVDDVVLYYEYLSAAVIYKDLSFSFSKTDPDFFRNKIWTQGTAKGRTVGKMTMGMALLYSPFIIAAHALAGPLGYPADGYSNPYRVALIISSFVFAMAGLFLLAIFLRKYFARGAVAITILALGLGTNLYFYTTINPAMSHAYSFFFFTFFILMTDRWVSEPGWKNTLLLGLAGGIIVLVRPSNLIIFILVPLWQVDSFPALKERFKLFAREFTKVIAVGFLVVLVFLPQVFYWKYSTGSFFHYSYGEEKFFFNDPVFLKGLFSYRKGWLVYTPVMVFSLLGMIVLYIKYRKLFWPVAVFTFINMYIIWSWWCWWYGGGFGQRAMIESYALLSIPLAAMIQLIISRKVIIRSAFMVLVFILVMLNIFQTYQYSVGIIHWDSMTRKSYWDTYIRTKVSPANHEQIEPPDYKAALKGDR